MGLFIRTCILWIIVLETINILRKLQQLQQQQTKHFQDAFEILP